MLGTTRVAVWFGDRERGSKVPNPKQNRFSEVGGRITHG